MRLTDIELDLPFLEKGDNSQERYIKLWKNKRMDFRLSTRCMTSMVSRLMKCTQRVDFWKIIVCCTEKAEDCQDVIIGGVINVYVNFDYKEYMNQSEFVKKVFVIDAIFRAVNKIEKERNINLQNVKNAIQQVRDLDYNNIWIWKESKKYNKTIRVVITHQIERVFITLICFDEDKQISSQTSEQPDEWFYANLLGKLIVKDHKAELISKSNDVVLSVDIDMENCIN